MFVLTVAAVIIAIGLSCFSRGRGAGLCAAWAAVFLCPAWMERKFGAFLLTPRLIAVVVATGFMVAFVDKLRVNKKLILLDYLVAAIAVIELISTYFSRELTITMMAQSIGSWCVPYFFGRLIATADITEHGRLRIMNVTILVICLLSVWGMVESIAGFNPVNTALGRPEYGASFRWGLRRAEGPLQHPIHFGNMMLMLFPWTLEAARIAFQGRGPLWWRFAPVAGFLGVFSSLSRGPLIGLFIVVGTVCLVQLPRLRPAIISAGIAVFFMLIANFTGFVNALQNSSGEEQTWGEYTVAIDGHDYVYTGTNHRLLQFLVFRRPLEEAGAFGFGTWGIKPKHIAYIDPNLRAKFWSIDNHYILMTLRTGYLGLFTFFALGGTALCYALRLGMFSENDALLASGMCGALFASMVLLWSVWFAPDFSFVWLTSVGLVGGWWANAQVR